MRFTGKIQSWNEERGFGFIRPDDGGQDIFVHISELSGRQPLPGDVLSFEVALNRDGKKKAIHVRTGAGAPADRAAASIPRGNRIRLARNGSQGSGWIARVVVLALIGGLGWAAFTRFGGPQSRAAWTAPPPAASSGLLGDLVKPSSAPSASQSLFRCDGRVSCSQMTSCEEATFFLRNCPGTKMDGDGDGIPCESQWCK